MRCGVGRGALLRAPAFRGGERSRRPSGGRALQNLSGGTVFWEAVRRWIRVTWVCRVSVTSVAVGAILFFYVPQARDLLLDFPAQASGGGRFDLLWMAWYAACFGALVLFFWALPVHAMARLSLIRD